MLVHRVIASAGDSPAFLRLVFFAGTVPAKGPFPTALAFRVFLNGFLHKFDMLSGYCPCRLGPAFHNRGKQFLMLADHCLLYTSPSPRD